LLKRNHIDKKITFFQGGEHLPDMVFAANAAIIRGKKAYLANFQCVERKNERHFYKKWLQAHGYETFGSMDYAFEGKGYICLP
jgi:N-dimethylarginine dimethylaminohydrolase